jgi:sensor histidine kinase YesM
MKLNKYTVLSILSFSFFVQLIIITYNYLTGFIDVSSFGNYIVRLGIGTTLSFLFAIVLVFIDIQIINGLDKFFHLPQKLFKRIPIEFLLAVSTGILIGSSVTIFADALKFYADGLLKNVINNSLITSILNLIVITVLEAIVWFKRSQQSLLLVEGLEKENSRIRFETLRSQLNPHFLFNSLNALSSLIKKDSDKAQNFIDEFSSVYRYTLDVIEKPVVELREEIDFAKSFLFLQKIRFDKTVTTELNIDASKFNYLVPPLAVQTLLENSFKHNRASIASPLKIKIYSEGKYLLVINNLQPKTNYMESKRVGLRNLTKRYELLGEQLPVFSVTENDYIAKIPLIKPD